MTDNKDIYIAGINKASFADGIGVRYTVFCSYCPHHCEGCHNQKYWNIESGVKISTSDILNDITKLSYKPDITFSGGEPFSQAEGFFDLAQKIKTNTDRTIWCYSGFTFEELLAFPKESNERKLLNLIDVLVDGKFIQDLADKRLAFKGSSNQRVIDVKKSLKENKIVLYNLD